MHDRQKATRSDEELIAAFQEGRLDAFNLLVERYKHQLVNFAYRFLGDYDEADDVAQETFIRLYRNKDSYRPVAKFSTWLYTIAANLAKTQLRRRKRHAIFSLTRERDEGEERMMEIPDVRYAADAVADSSLKQEIIEQALNSISPKYREVVVLCDVQELTYEEICAITGLNIGTVKSRLNRGRAQLQELLKGLKEEG
ncbi:MAG TPA: sigma-70 family RNA polymerase sigma factor [Bacteroidota bacterium]|jgi:RNA polymerase sigma-70 factor (ECF subfamily)|nr:sigma-70 family RNA polymerase sigma factor [Bacteroidota bacterium]